LVSLVRQRPDVSVEKLLVASGGEYFPNTRPYERVMFRLRMTDRNLSSKMRRSGN
jgi:putative transposase